MKFKLFMVTLIAVVFCFGGAALADKTICIGYSTPLTGEHAQYGQMFRKAATMQLEKFNASGQLPGYKVEIKFEDSKSDPKEGRNIAAKFVDDKCIVGVIADFTSTVSMAAGRVYAKAKMPQLSQTASHPDYTKVSKWQFRNITTQAYEGPFMASWAKEGGIKTVGIIGVQNDWGISAVTNFEKAFKAGGGKVVAVEYFNPGVRDYRAILTKINRQNPDAIYICVMYEAGALLMQQVKQLGMKCKVYATSPLYSPKFLKLAGDDANGLYLSTTFMVDSPEPHVKDFVTKFEKKYNVKPNMFAAQAYDAAGIMLAAIVRALKDGKITRSELRDELAATTDYPGVTGATSFDKETREPSKVLARMRVLDGKFVLAK